MIVSSIIQFSPITTSFKIIECLTLEPLPTTTPGDNTDSSTSPNILHPSEIKEVEIEAPEPTFTGGKSSVLV